MLNFAIKGKGLIIDYLQLSPYGLALMRIGLGLSVVIEAWERLLSFKVLNSAAGLFPASYVEATFFNQFGTAPFLPSAHFFFASDLGQIALAFVQLILGGIIAAGLFGRWSVALLLYLVCSSNLRMFFYLKGGDVLLPWLTLMCLVLPVRRVWALRTQHEKASTRHALAFICMMFSIYVSTGMSKVDPLWSNGNAIEYALRAEYATSTLGLWIAQFGELLKVISPAVPILEVIVPLLLFVPSAILRTSVCLFFISFHLALGISLNLSNLTLILVSLWSGLLPQRFFDFFLARLKFWDLPRLTKISATSPIVSNGKIPQYVRSLVALGLPTLVLASNLNVISTGDGASKFSSEVRKALLGFGIRADMNFYSSVPRGVAWVQFLVHFKNGNSQPFDLFANRWSEIGVKADSRPNPVSDSIPSRRFQAVFECFGSRPCGKHYPQIHSVLCNLSKHPKNGDAPERAEIIGSFISFKTGKQSRNILYSSVCQSVITNF